VEIAEGQGLDATQYDLVRAALERDPEIRAVYSIGGGNIATLRAFEDLGRECAVFVAHDLDHDNDRLLREHRLSAVLHHDLRQDMREACHIVMRAHGALPPAGPTTPSAIQVVTPYNMPY
jgi:LacI family transcriptional regulator